MSVDLTGAHWFKSSRSGGKDDCVEVAHLDGGMVGVRDSKNPTGPALIFTPGEWEALASRRCSPPPAAGASGFVSTFGFGGGGSACRRSGCYGM